MTRQVVNFDNRTHEKVERLLPWFVNGTLGQEEQTMVEQHVGECVRCRRDAVRLRKMQMAHADVDMTSDATRSFDKLRAQLHPSQDRNPLEQWAREWRQRFRSATSWMRPALALSLSGVAGFAIFLAIGPPLAIYRTLGINTPQRVQGSVVVVFDPQTKENEIHRILHEIGARVVDGPMNNGAYVLQLPPGSDTPALTVLHRSRAVVLAEPLREGTTR